MPNKLIMKCVGGPYGDCTSTYEFTMLKQMTLKEFAEMVAADKKEWGAIRKRTLALYLPNMIEAVRLNIVIAQTLMRYSRQRALLTVAGL